MKCRIQDSVEPVVGLKFITEWFPCSAKLDPYYECDLCQAHGKVEVMMSHLLGKMHKEKFLCSFKGGQVKKEEIGRYLRDFDDRDKGSELIQTIFSDEQYPWPEKKAPWSISAGGSGIPPTLSKPSLRYRRHNYNKTDEQMAYEEEIKEEERIAKKMAEPVLANIDPAIIQSITKNDQLKHYSTLFHAVLNKISKYQLQNGNEADLKHFNNTISHIDRLTVSADRMVRGASISSANQNDVSARKEVTNSVVGQANTPPPPAPRLKPITPKITGKKVPQRDPRRR